MTRDDELTLTVDGQQISGWQGIDLTLRAEGFPSSFSIEMSAKAQILLSVRAGAVCEVRLGDDVVVTGYVDRQLHGGDATAHTIAVLGRGKTQDLVDCSAEWPSGQMTDVDVLTIAQTIAKPYGITVALGPGAAAGKAVPQWLLNFGETGAEIIQRCARNAGLLALEDSAGRLVLATVGTKRAASGAVYGHNVERWSHETSMDGRYSEIVCSRQSTDTLQDLGGSDFYDTATDPNVPRHRLLYRVVEPVGRDDPEAFTSTKARWDLARRAGRASVVTVTLDSWRDSAGDLWAPNTLVPVQLPSIAADLVVGEVTFHRNSQTGTTANLTLMPAGAFVPEPISLEPVNLAGTTGPGGS